MIAESDELISSVLTRDANFSDLGLFGETNRNT
jgi:hypothetical protein